MFEDDIQIPILSLDKDLDDHNVINVTSSELWWNMQQIYNLYNTVELLIVDPPR